jgi:hypothetical protein
MAKADRLERLDARRAELETEYAVELVAALRVTASGKWGLFDPNGDRRTRAATAPIFEKLSEIGEAIDKSREQLGLPRFELHQQFLASRGKPSPSAAGEPRHGSIASRRRANCRLADGRSWPMPALDLQPIALRVAGLSGRREGRVSWL